MSYQGEDLIFIISQPRSGSTLLQRVLSGHPGIQTSAETWLMLPPVYAMKPEACITEYNAKSAATGARDFLRYYTDGVEVYDEAIRNWAATLYGHALKKSGRKYFLDKTPRYFFIIPELYRLFPRARFVFLLRNPLAVLASLLSTYVQDDWCKLGFFRYDLLRAPSLILEGVRVVGSDAVVLHYEAFVSNPEEELARLCERLGIAFHSAMLDYAASEPPKGKLNDPVGVKQHSRPSTGSLEKWKRLGENEQHRHLAACYLEALGKEVIDSMGYEMEELAAAGFDADCASLCSPRVFPFGLAITPKAEWNYRQWYQAERYYRVTRKGALKGELSAARRGLLHGLRALRRQLT